MIFFFWSLFLSLVITSVMLILLFRSLKINQERKNRLAVGFFTPVFLTIAFLFLAIQLTIPQLLDTVALVSKTYSIEEVEVKPDSLGWNSLTIDKHRYFYNQLQLEIKPDQRYRIEFTPRSRYIVSATLVETVVANPVGIAITKDIETEKTSEAPK